MAAPLVLAGFFLLALVAMISDRGARRSEAREMPWWEGFFVDTMVLGHKVVAAPVDGVSSVWNGYIDLVGVREQNAQLKSRVADLEEELLQYREALVTSGHLQRIAEMRKDHELPMLPSEVVGFDSGPVFRSVLLDRGGVCVQLPVQRRNARVARELVRRQGRSHSVQLRLNLGLGGHALGRQVRRALRQFRHVRRQAHRIGNRRPRSLVRVLQGPVSVVCGIGHERSPRRRGQARRLRRL